MNCLKNNKSSLLFLVLFIIMGSAHLFYPKWQKGGTESTISWDVYGYYLYLPAYFIYDDIESLSFVEDINKKYHPAGENYKTIPLENGNATGQYSLGWTIFHLPAFALGHVLAKLSTFPADGFSKPYPMAISFYGLIFAYLALLLSFSNLRKYFSFKVSALSLLLLLLGTNALNYFAIDSAHTHGPLFFLYSLLIYLSISWHQKPSIFKSICIGLVYGLMCTIRPTEIIAILIPLFWGIGSWEGLKMRLELFKSKAVSVVMATLAFLIFPAFQLSYWKIITGHFLFYSYVGQGFSWLHPHIVDVLFSYRKGWLIYTPLALLFLLGLPFLFKKAPKLFYTIFFFFLINFYIISAWDIWWYGGSLGQRALIQSYALLLFPLAALLESSLKESWSKLLLAVFCSLGILHNLSFHYKAHSLAPFEAEAMTEAFFKRSYFEFKPNSELFKLLDTDFIYEDALVDSFPLEGLKISFSISGANASSQAINLKKKDNYTYLRIYFTALSPKVQNYYWNMPQLNVLQIDNNDLTVQSNFLRLHRFMKAGKPTEMYFDVQLNKETELIKVNISNPYGEEDLYLDIDQVVFFN